MGGGAGASLFAGNVVTEAFPGCYIAHDLDTHQYSRLQNRPSPASPSPSSSVSPAHNHPLTSTPTHPLPLPHTHKHARTRTRTRTCTHSHTHTSSLSNAPSLTHAHASAIRALSRAVVASRRVCSGWELGISDFRPEEYGLPSYEELREEGMNFEDYEAEVGQELVPDLTIDPDTQVRREGG